MQPSADSAEVKRAYAKLLKVHRPDRDPLGFQALHEAYGQALALAGQLVLGDTGYQDDGEYAEDEASEALAERQPDPNVPARPNALDEATVRVAIRIDAELAVAPGRLAQPKVCVIDSDEAVLATDAIAFAQPEPELAVQMGLHLTEAQANALAAESMQFLANRAPAAELQDFLYGQSSLEDFRTRNAFGQLLLDYLAGHQQAPLSASFAVLRDFFGFDARAGRDADAGNEALVRAISLDAGQQQLEYDYHPPGWRTAQAQKRSNMLKQLLGPPSDWRMFCNALLLGRVNDYNALIYHYDLMSGAQSERLLGPGRREAWAALASYTPWTRMHTALVSVRVLLALAFLACLPAIALKAPPLAFFALAFGLRYVGAHAQMPLVLLSQTAMWFSQPRVYAATGGVLVLGAVAAPLHLIAVFFFVALLFLAFVFSHSGLGSLLSSCVSILVSGIAISAVLPGHLVGTRAFLLIPSLFLAALYALRYQRSRATDTPLYVLAEQSRWALYLASALSGLAVIAYLLGLASPA